MSAVGLLWAPNLHGATLSVELLEPVSVTGTVEVRAISGARVTVDGASCGEVPASVELPAGEHRLEVTAPGHHPWRATIEIRSGATVSMMTELVALDAIAEPVPSPRPSPRLDDSPPRSAPASAGVFLPTERKRVLLTTNGQAPGASALLTSKAQTPGASALLTPSRERTRARQTNVFLATERPSALLAPRKPPEASVFLSEQRPGRGDVFMPVEHP